MAAMPRGPRVLTWAMLTTTVLAGCSAPTLAPKDAQRMIEAHPRFQAPETLRIPARACVPRVTPPSPPSPGVPPPVDPYRLDALQSAKAIAVTRHAPNGDECASRPGTEIAEISLTPLASMFHPTTLAEGRAWEFALARRRFVAIDSITYDSPDEPKLAHVQYSWVWEADLLGQLLGVGGPKQGASATFLRDGNGWIVRQPGM
jgi:hypothetical protein